MEDQELKDKFLEVMEIKAQAQVIVEKCIKKLNQIRRKYHETKNVRN